MGEEKRIRAEHIDVRRLYRQRSSIDDDQHKSRFLSVAKSLGCLRSMFGLILCDERRHDVIGSGTER